MINVSETRWHGKDIVEKGTYAGSIPEIGAKNAVIPAHPIAWYHNYSGGRAFYTSMGHENYYNEPDFGKHILGAVRWAAGCN